MIGTRDSRESCMTLAVHLLDAFDGNVLMQQSVELLSQHGSVEVHIRVEVGSHAARMDARVRPSCSRHTDVLTQQQRQAALQLALHRHPVGLYLPPVILGAVIAEPNKITFHSKNLLQRYPFFRRNKNKSETNFKWKRQRIEISHLSRLHRKSLCAKAFQSRSDVQSPPSSLPSSLPSARTCSLAKARTLIFGYSYWSAYGLKIIKKLIKKLSKLCIVVVPCYFFYNFLGQFSYNFERSDQTLT